MPKTKPELKLGKLKKKGKRARERTQVLKIVVQAPAGKAPSTQTAPFKTGMNRDIPMGGAGGSPNLLSNLLSSRQQQPAQVIQTPDQFKLQQDIKGIKEEQAGISEEIQQQKKERKERSDKGKVRGARANVEDEKEGTPFSMPEGEKIKIRVKAPLKEQLNPMTPEQLAEQSTEQTEAKADFSHSLRGMEPIGANPTDVF